MTDSRPPLPQQFLPQVQPLLVTSTDIADGQTLPADQVSGLLGAGGGDISPHLSWTGAPEDTRSFAITCFDPDAPTWSGFWHWAVFDLPTDLNWVPAGAGSPDGALPAGARVLRNDAGLRQYVGAAPPPGHGPHRYIFAVHAVSVPALELSDDAPVAQLGFNLFLHSLARGEITPTYQR